MAPSTGISQFVSRVLEQLSLSSWLPAAMFVGSGAVLLQLRSDHSLNLGRALGQLTATKPIGTLIVVLFALVTATMVMQAFEFEVIRLLEGYVNPRSRAMAALVAWRIRRRSGKRARLKDQLDGIKRQALDAAKQHLEAQPDIDPAMHELMRIVAADLMNEPLADPAPSAQLQATAVQLPWREYVDSALLYRLDALNSSLGSWPDEHRIMPTTFGNVLRAAEDGLELNDGQRLEGFVIRHFDRLPSALRRHHREYRTRLDLYCSLLIVCDLLGVLSVAALILVARYGASR